MKLAMLAASLITTGVLTTTQLDMGTDVEKEVLEATCRYEVVCLGKALQLYRVTQGCLPAENNFEDWALGLGEGIEDTKDVDDPWGMPYVYERLSHHSFSLTSAGPDMKYETPDDIVFK